MCGLRKPEQKRRELAKPGYGPKQRRARVYFQPIRPAFVQCSWVEHTRYQGSRGGPDFVGQGKYKGYTFEVTTTKGAAAKAGKYPGVLVPTYERCPGFKGFPRQ